MQLSLRMWHSEQGSVPQKPLRPGPLLQNHPHPPIRRPAGPETGPRRIPPPHAPAPQRPASLPSQHPTARAGPGRAGPVPAAADHLRPAASRRPRPCPRSPPARSPPASAPSGRLRLFEFKPPSLKYPLNYRLSPLAPLPPFARADWLLFNRPARRLALRTLRSLRGRASSPPASGAHAQRQPAAYPE